MSINPISTLKTISSISSSQDVLMIVDSTNNTTKKILPNVLSSVIHSTLEDLSGDFSGSFIGNGTNLTGVTAQYNSFKCFLCYLLKCRWSLWNR